MKVNPHLSVFLDQGSIEGNQLDAILQSMLGKSWTKVKVLEKKYDAVCLQENPEKTSFIGFISSCGQFTAPPQGAAESGKSEMCF